MNITGTLTQLKQFFEEWHSSDDNKFITLHQRLIDRMDTIEANKDLNTEMFTNNLLSIANLISNKLDGDATQITDITQLSTITSKNEAKNNTINLKNFNNRLSNLETLPSIIGTDTSSNKTIVQRLQFLENTNQSEANIDSRVNIGINNFIKGANIQSNDSLNNYVTPGVYKSITDNISSSLTNCPTKKSFNLIVLEHENNSVRQIISEYSSNDIWVRNYQNRTTSWSEWSKLYGTHNTIPFQMQIEFENSTKNYTILATDIQEAS